ncbi:unnamed protein product [Macrosiphum euphorbiae]|uniref:Uncharacterized protein n=1 Tax=Macrosiphum euphorbiae TaxID=13131 RepID=A0AAV0Y199_9HEMI|nr:unnamed protein product [Macrosiphum euphorbiae]
MSPTSAVQLHILLENPVLRHYFLKKNKRQSVHNMNKCRSKFGEFHHVYKNLREHPDRFFKFLRMSIATFDFLVNRIKGRISKKKTNFKEPISATERTYVTLR